MNEALLIQRKKILSYNNNIQGEWWWSLDTSLDIIHNSLNNNRYCIIDDFLLDNECNNVYDEVQAAYQQGLLNSRGFIAGGRKGDDTLKVEDESIRNDTLGYFDGNEDEWPSGSNQGGLTRALDKINTIVYELRDHQKKKKNDDSNELKNVKTRSRAMITCYAGNGSKYSKHCDNPIRNGRKLTVILYLNKNWNTDTDGGCLRLYHPYNTSNHNHYIDIKPTFNSLLLFWSDFRCPHEVLPCYRHRFAITCWFIDSIEKKEADDNEKIEKEKNTDSTSDVKNTNTTDVFELD